MPQQRYRVMYDEAVQRCMRKTLGSTWTMQMNALFLRSGADQPGELMAVYHLQGPRPWDLQLHQAHFHVGQTKLMEIHKQPPIDWSLYEWLIEPDGTVVDVSAPQ